jgi:hypothetical protein
MTLTPYDLIDDGHSVRLAEDTEIGVKKFNSRGPEPEKRRVVGKKEDLR